jgi:HSP20 family protein
MAKESKETAKERGGLIPWSAFPEMTRWEEQMQRMFGDFLGGRIRPLLNFGVREPAIDLYEEKDDIVVKAELPGLTKDDIQINIADHHLILKGEKKKDEEVKEKDYYRSERVYGAFTRALPLPAEINPEKVHATFKNGVLEVRLPKSEEAKKKEISIKVEG